MAFTCDPTTRAELNAAANKLQWATVLNAALGNTRRVRCKRDPDNSAADPWATGTEFRNVGCTGAIKTQAGKIIGLGRLKGSTVRLPADISTGKSVLRIEGNGRWIQGTLGPVGSNADFAASGNFTAANGLSVSTSLAISGPRLLASGTGPAAPALDANAPNKFEVWDWTNPNAPVLSGTVTLNNRADDFVYEDAELAAINGDVAVYQSTQSAMLGEHEVGFTLLASHKGNTEANIDPLYQVLGSFATRGTWTTYPFADTYDQTQHVTTPRPFKVVMKTAAGVVLHTFEMHDGKAINDPTLHSQDWYSTLGTTTAVRPLFNTGMKLPWQNTKPRKSQKADKWYAGIDTSYQRPSIAKQHYTFNGTEPALTGGYQGNSQNGLHHIYQTDRWAHPYKERPSFTPGDPYLSGGAYQNDGSADSRPWMDGWDYEPGSYSNHNWYTGPGGVRPDRGYLHSTLALWTTNPTGTRLLDGTPWRDMTDACGLAFFNHSNHWVTNPKTMQLLPNEKILDGTFSMLEGYYLGGGDPRYGVQLKGAMRDGDNAEHRDKNGHFIWSGWVRDGLHAYCQAGWMALLQNSPMHGVGSKWDTITGFGINGTATNYTAGSFYMVREMAWAWMHYVMAWKLGSSHALGFTRSEIEARFATHLESIYRDIYKPAYIDNNPAEYYEWLRRSGTPSYSEDGHGGGKGGQLGYYMTGVLMFMKQSGFWSEMMAKGGNIKTVLEMVVGHYDKQCFERILYTKRNRPAQANYQLLSLGLENMPTGWADWSAQNEPQDGSDYTHNADGSIRPGDQDVSDHLFMNYPHMRKNYFPEITHPLLQAAYDKIETEMAQTAANVAVGTSPDDKRNRDYTYGYPAVARIKAPTELGPA